VKARSIAITLGLTLLVLATATPGLPAAEEPVGPFPDRIRLSAPAHDPGSIEVSPEGERVTYYDFAEGKMYVADITTGQRRWLGDFPPWEVEYTPDGNGVVVRIDPVGGSHLRRRGLESGSVEINSESLSLLNPLFSTTFDGLSVVHGGSDGGIKWWDKDGSVRTLTATSAGGLGAAPDRDLILYSTHDGGTDQTTIRGITSTGVETTFGAMDGIAGYSHDKTEFTFLPDQDRAIVSLQLRDGRNLAWGSWILDLVTEELDYAAPAFTPQVSPDGSVAFFEVEDSGLVYGRIVPTENPDQAVDLPDQVPSRFWVHPDWTHVAESGDGVRIYEMDGTFVRNLNASGGSFTATFVDDYFVSSQEFPSNIPVFSYRIDPGSSERISRAVTRAWVLGGYDGFVYWREFKNGTWDIWRAEPNGRWRARITRSYDGLTEDFVEVVPATGMLVFEAQGSIWAIDLDVLPEYACLNLLATHIGTNGHDVIDGTDGDDVILGLSGNDIIRGGEGRDRLCGNHGNDRLVGELGDDRIRGDNDDDELLGKGGDDIIIDRQGSNDVDGGSGTDTCKVTGVMTGCELP
jgi:hypothetical protein